MLEQQLHRLLPPKLRRQMQRSKALLIRAVDRRTAGQQLAQLRDVALLYEERSFF